MVHLLGAKSPDEIGYYHEFLDGDWSKIKAVDPSVDGGLSFTWTKLNGGFAIRGDHLSTKVQKNGPKREVPDVEFLRMLCVSGRFKEAIESFEPNIHQFFPVDVLWEDGELAAKRFFFNICTRLDSISRQLTTVPFNHFWQTAGNANARLVFDSSTIGSRHIWCDKYLLFNPFVSDALAESLRAAGFTGLSLQHFDQT